MSQILITGGAGFIGSNLIEKLIADKNTRIVCLDNFDNYYSKSIKLRNIKKFIKEPNLEFIDVDITRLTYLKEKLKDYSFDSIIHLAAKGGVRPSINSPIEYMNTNVIGTASMLEIALACKTQKFIFASSSSVYGVNPKYPWSEDDHDYRPISPYATSKLSAEMLGHVYQELHKIKFIALRFFTVYGPRQRPDLAINKFIISILKGIPINVYGKGDTLRDYTYIDDVVSGITKAMYCSDSVYEVINIGNNKPCKLLDLIQIIEKILDKKATINYFDEQPGDVPVTCANIDKAQKILGYNPLTSLETGIKNQVDWIIKNSDIYGV